MKLFVYRDFRLQIDPLAYTVKAFKDLEKRDRTVNKTQLEKELAFIYFTYDPRSDLQYISDEKERIERVKELIGLDSKFKVDPLIQKAIDTYISMTETTSSLLLKDIKAGVDKVRGYIKDANVDDDTFDKYIRALGTLVPLSQKISEVEKVVIREVEELAEARGNKASTILDSGFDGLMK